MTSSCLVFIHCLICSLGAWNEHFPELALQSQYICSTVRWNLFRFLYCWHIFHEFLLQGLHYCNMQVKSTSEWIGKRFFTGIFSCKLESMIMKYSCTAILISIFRPSFKFHKLGQRISLCESIGIVCIHTKQYCFQSIHLICFLREWIASSCLQQFSWHPCSKDWAMWAVPSEYFPVFFILYQ